MGRSMDHMHASRWSCLHLPRVRMLRNARPSCTDHWWWGSPPLAPCGDLTWRRIGLCGSVVDVAAKIVRASSRSDSIVAALMRGAYGGRSWLSCWHVAKLYHYVPLLPLTLSVLFPRSLILKLECLFCFWFLVAFANDRCILVWVYERRVLNSWTSMILVGAEEKVLNASWSMEIMNLTAGGIQILTSVSVVVENFNLDFMIVSFA